MDCILKIHRSHSDAFGRRCEDAKKFEGLGSATPIRVNSPAGGRSNPHFYYTMAPSYAPKQPEQRRGRQKRRRGRKS